MTKWTDAKLKKQAINEWKDCYECGHFPEFICDQPYVDEEDLKDYAKEYDMTLEEFKKYVDYFIEYNETRM